MEKLLDISMVITCYNEKQSVENWAKSFLNMKYQPTELVVVDALSSDGCIDLLAKELERYSGRLVIESKQCNIAQGRNLGIQKAENQLIAITDFGVTFSEYWLYEIYNTLKDSDVCAGSYILTGSNKIQKAYNDLFQRDLSLLNENNFTPSSRSFGLNKERLKEVGYYNERLNIAEDTEFVNRIRANKLKIKFNREALVYWDTRENLKKLFFQHYRYSFWDAIARQSKFRYNHQLYVLCLIVVPILATIFLSFFIGLISFLLISSSIVFRKYIKVDARKRFLLQYLVYNTVICASAIGYCFGKFRRD